MKRLMIFVMLISCAFLFAQTEAKVIVYEEGFNGAQTTSGDIYSPDEMTAAHESLPFGTKVEIMNIINGNKVIVTVNDRIKNAPDLFWISAAAAEKLEIDAEAPVEVLYTIIGDLPEMGTTEVYDKLFAGLGENLEHPEGDPRIPRSSGEEISGYGVQVYACVKRMDAVTLSRRIQEELEYISYFEKYKSDNGSSFRVVIGDFETLEEARDCYWKLRYDLPDIFLVEIY